MDAKRLRAILRNYSHVRGAVRGRRNYQNAHTFTRNRNAKWTWATTAKHESARSLAKACQLASLLRRDNLRPNPLHLGCDGPVLCGCVSPKGAEHGDCVGKGAGQSAPGCPGHGGPLSNARAAHELMPSRNPGPLQQRYEVSRGKVSTFSEILLQHF